MFISILGLFSLYSLRREGVFLPFALSDEGGLPSTLSLIRRRTHTECAVSAEVEGGPSVRVGGFSAKVVLGFVLVILVVPPAVLVGINFARRTEL